MDRLNEFEKNERIYKRISYLVISIVVLLAFIFVIVSYNDANDIKYNITLYYSDNETEVSIKEDTTVKEVLKDEKIDVDEDDFVKLNEVYLKLDALDSYILKEHDYLQVEIVEIVQEVVENDINFEVVNKNDDSLFVGEIAVDVKGKKGVKEVTYEIKTIDGKEISKEIIKTEIITEPIDKVVLNGTKVEEQDTYIEEESLDNYVSDEPSDNLSELDENEPPVQSNDEECSISINGIETSCN